MRYRRSDYDVTNTVQVSSVAAVRRAVETGLRTESAVHILSGLSAGDVVITSGLQQMRAGLPVVPTAMSTLSSP